MRKEDSHREEPPPDRATQISSKPTDVKSAPPRDSATFAERPGQAQDQARPKPEPKAERHQDSVEMPAHKEPAEKAKITKKEHSAPANDRALFRPMTSSHVARAQLTSGIKDKEPVDRVSGVFHSNNISLRRLYYFTDLVGLRGETVTHSWWHDGRRMARVTSHVRSNSWRMSSSKKLLSSMAGPWRVVVTDSHSKKLSVARFVYKVP